MQNSPENCYFIVLDEAPIKGSPTPKYDLLFGNPDTVIGCMQATGRTIKELIKKLTKEELCYRVYLNRTDGKTGKKRLKII